MLNVALGALFAALIAIGAYRARSLSLDGAIAAFAVGTIVFGCTQWRGAAILLAFFLPSAVLTRLGRERKSRLSESSEAKARNAWQVFANGGVAAFCALLAQRFGAPFDVAFAGAFAAASADTWGTEIGTLARGRPVSILTFRPIQTGLSGGISLQGSVATIGGALFVGTVAGLAGFAPLLSVTIGGIAGALVDSLLGASLQALRWCPSCRCDCETSPHLCGTPTTLRRGFAWFQNDAVNFCATVGGALVAALGAR
ncbi:MAG TPA: DUF92 domain-containing protein [Candidatus Cybelea sp.]|nr:DUF92 domain-containing protein [Candidatus Cybelea sp.]